jgi:hypothetical protein
MGLRPRADALRLGLTALACGGGLADIMGTMRHRITSAGFAALAAAGLTAAASAQMMGDPSAPASMGLKPIDQGVGDIDPRATSLRRVESGLRIDGEQTSLFQLNQPVDLVHRPQYYRIGPGFRARTDRLNYLVLDKDDPGTRKRPNFAFNQQPRVDGEFIELVGPNTVFELTLGYESPFITPPQIDDRPLPDARLAPVIDSRLDGRLDTLIDGRLETRIDGTPGAMQPLPLGEPLSQ